MRSGQLEDDIVIKRRWLPCHSRVACLAFRREPGRMGRVRRAVEIREVTADALSRCP